MKPEIQSAIAAQLQKLPKQIQMLVISEEWKKWVGKIVIKHSFHLDQAVSLESEIFTFLVGLQSVFDLRKGIQNELNLPASEVNEVMIDVNDMIVEPLKQKLIAATDESEEVIASSMPIVKTIQLDQKEKEISERQHILDAIEEVNHAPGIGVYVPESKQSKVEMKKVEPIANTQITAPAEVIKIEPKAESKPASILESKMSAVVAPKHEHVVVPAAAPVAKVAGPDPYREAI